MLTMDQEEALPNNNDDEDDDEASFDFGKSAKGESMCICQAID